MGTLTQNDKFIKALETTALDVEQVEESDMLMRLLP